jgi:hypothetical protein
MLGMLPRNRPFVLVLVLVLDWVARLRGRARRRVGSWSLYTRRNAVGTFHEPSEAPPGFGLRRSSGALAMEASQPKAPEHWRSPSRYRAIRRFMVPIHAENERRLPMNRKVGQASRLPRRRSRPQTCHPARAGALAGQAGRLPYVRPAPVHGPKCAVKRPWRFSVNRTLAGTGFLEWRI